MAEFIIVFREVLEGALIAGVLYTFLKKSHQESLIVRLWQGVGTAIVLSIVGSILFQQFAGGFKGQAGKIFEGVVMIAASIVLGTMIVWMAKNSNITEDLKSKASKSLTGSNAGWGIFTLAFISVFREGVETILFLYGVLMQKGNLSIISSVIGVFLALGLTYMIFVQGTKVPLKKFFNVSSIALIFVAGGMMAYGVHELESAGLIKDFGRLWNINPPKLPDGSYPLFHDKGYIGGLFKGLFGYNGDPSAVELIAWLVTVSGLGYMWKTISEKSV